MAEFPPDDLEIGERPAHVGHAVGVIERFTEADAFLRVGDPFLELSPLGEIPSQIAADRHGGKSSVAKPFPARISFEQLQDFQEKILRPSIVARPVAGHAEIEIARHLERNIPKRFGNSLGALAERERFRRMPVT